MCFLAMQDDSKTLQKTPPPKQKRVDEGLEEKLVRALNALVSYLQNRSLYRTQMKTNTKLKAV